MTNTKHSTHSAHEDEDSTTARALLTFCSQLLFYVALSLQMETALWELHLLVFAHELGTSTEPKFSPSSRSEILSNTFVNGDRNIAFLISNKLK